MTTRTRDEIQNAYIRVCRDSHFTLDWVVAAQLAGKMMDTNALGVWTTFGSLDTMREIARGEHPVCRKG